MVTRWIFAGFVGLLALQRILELSISRRNERLIRLRGGRGHVPEQLRWMKFIHTGWFISTLVEVFALRRPFIPGLALIAATFLTAGQSLRYAAIRSLGWRWTVSLMTIPGEVPVQKGIYRFLRHPNYLGVIFELAAVPLLHTAYITALIFSIANGLLICARIRAEETALQEDGGYQAVFENMPRFFPLRKSN